ncbi:MAG: UPF0179 family protein [Candidatus Thermoplasmatota archaeon]|nr:UPF0179 family protein [Candidatus Thermoplasmatota archaeon]
MGKVSLIGKTLAKEGRVFMYAGPAPECGKCKLNTICQNLAVGRKYRVVKVRDKEHDCPAHDQDKVVAVEVEELPLEMSIPDRKALESAIVTIDGDGCRYRWCDNNHLCRYEGIPKGTKVLLLTIEEDLVCPISLKLKRAVVEIR